jgi:hypothetical protein
MGDIVHSHCCRQRQHIITILFMVLCHASLRAHPAAAHHQHPPHPLARIGWHRLTVGCDGDEEANITVSVNTTLLQRSGEWVMVSWKGEILKYIAEPSYVGNARHIGNAFHV